MRISIKQKSDQLPTVSSRSHHIFLFWGTESNSSTHEYAAICFYSIADVFLSFYLYTPCKDKNISIQLEQTSIYLNKFVYHQHFPYLYMAATTVDRLDTLIFSEFVRKNLNVDISLIVCLYLESTLKMHQNEYKQAYVWSSGS